MRRKGICRLFDAHLGTRVKQAKYKYSDVALSWIFSILCGSQRLEDTKKLSVHLNNIPDTKHPSPDRIAAIFKSFATPSTTYITSANINHELNIHLPLNNLLLDTALKLGMIEKDHNNILDYDNLIIPCEKYDSRRTYKKVDGYCPGVAFIGKTPVYIENRNGNSNADYKMQETLERALYQLKSKGIKIKRFRSDNAAYSRSVISLMDSERIDFFIRAENSDAIFEDVLHHNHVWEDVWIGDKPWSITSVDYSFYGKIYKVVVTKGRDSRRKHMNKYSEDLDTMRAIITNNKDMSNKDIVSFYNNRATTELNFTALLNDWNFKRPPFSFLNENTVFFLFSAMGFTMYQYLLRKFSKKIPFVKLSFRLKKFIFHFISCSLEWIIENNERVAQFSTEKDYSPLYGRPPSESK